MRLRLDVRIAHLPLLKLAAVRPNAAFSYGG